MDHIRQQHAQFAKDEEETLLTLRYSQLGEWFGVMRTLCSRSGKPLPQALREALDDNRKLTNEPLIKPQRFKPQDGESYIRDTTSRERIREPDYGTLLKQVRTGPDLLRFFCMLCPHARDALLNGQLPAYPWRASTVITVDATRGCDKNQNGRGPQGSGTTRAEAIDITPNVGSKPILGDSVNLGIVSVHWRHVVQRVQCLTGWRKIAAIVVVALILLVFVTRSVWLPLVHYCIHTGATK